MLSLACWTITVAAVIGAVLALLFLKAMRPPMPLTAAVHGILGTFGLVVLALVLKRAGVSARGIASFGTYAAVLFAAAWIIGLIIAFLPLRSRRSVGLLIAGHATVALFGYVILLAFWSLG